MTTPTDTTTIALVTGATQGIGRETVRRLAALGWTVWLGARDVDAGPPSPPRSPATCASSQLDVLDDASVAAAAATVERGVRPARRAGQQRRRPGRLHSRRGRRSRHDFLPRLRRERARPGAHHARVPAAARPLVATPDRHGVQRHGLVRDHHRPGPVRVHAARAGLPVVQGRAEHDHVAVRQGADRLPGQRGRPRVHVDRPQRVPRHAVRASRAPSRRSAPRRSSPARRPGTFTRRARASCPGDASARAARRSPPYRPGRGGGERDDAAPQRRARRPRAGRW